MPPDDRIPRFELYGERARARRTEFLHIETIWNRSHRLDWTIRPHRHDDLVQLLFVSAGGGTLTIDGRAVRIVPPWLVALPPAVVHGFAFVPNTTGHVLTVSEDFLYLGCAPNAALPATLAEPLILNLPEGIVAGEVGGLFRRIAEEFAAARPRRTDALGALLRLLVIAVDRARAAAEIAAVPQEAGRATHARFRQLLEAHWREQRAVADYAAALGTTPGRLNAACKRACGRTATRLVRDRVLLEAKRNLIYTGRSVAEIAYELGFSEPAYFSRLFRKATGRTPREFRLSAPGR